MCLLPPVPMAPGAVGIRGRRGMQAGHKGLLVTGVARSGTTALAELLNAHEEICLGMERFKFQFLRQENFSDSLFDRARFFDFREEDTNILPGPRPQWQGLYDGIAQKWDGAKVVGDKVPDMLPVLPAFLAANPGFRCICILRSLKGVALSWQTRADDPRDSWPGGRGFELACESWQAQMQDLQALIASRTARGRILLLDYDRMSRPGNRSAEAILAFLGLSPSAAFREAHARYGAFAAGRAGVTRRVPERFQAIYRATDRTAFRALREKASAQMKRLTAGRRPAAAP